MSKKATLDGNEAVAQVAYALSEVIAIYPITPSSPMGEWADQWGSEGRPNLWGCAPRVVEMQSEGGAAGALHGALQAGALTTTFTASQGLLLMIPNMYKIAGELTPAVIHVAARSLATHALSIFCDHGDVMAARQTGFALLSSSSVQEAADMALVAHAATLESRVPFLHFMDGFRTSHEVMKINTLAAEDIRAIVSENSILAHRQRALSPDHPCLRGTTQNPDVFFQSRERSNPSYLACPRIVEETLAQLAKQTGRAYGLFDYHGDKDADRVIILMGSAAGAVREAVDVLRENGENVGLVVVHLFRPFSVDHLLACLPGSVRSLAVLDRTKEPGSTGEPLYHDVLTAMVEGFTSGKLPALPRIVGGRYGLGSKEFTPAMAKAVFDNLASAQPRNHFTVGIMDDITHTSLPFDDSFSAEPKETVRAIFYGLGADGTVGANKNSIKIIGEETDGHAQGFFVYDSKKSGSMTISHLRFGPRPIHSTYLISKASFVACHQFGFLERIDVLDAAAEGATLLLNCPYESKEAWSKLPRPIQERIIAKKLKLYTIDAAKVSRDAGLGERINTVMQTCFFALSGIMPADRAIAAIKHSVEKTYGKRGAAVVRKNHAAIDAALAELHQVDVPTKADSRLGFRLPVPVIAPEIVQRLTAPMIAGRGDSLPVSQMPLDGTYPSGTAKWEKRGIALEVPTWDESLCIQCGKCVLVCPHSVILGKLCEPDRLEGAPEGFQSAPARWREHPGARYTLQVSPDDCTGCALCVEVCPAKNKSQSRLKAINMTPLGPIHDRQARDWEFFESLPESNSLQVDLSSIKDVQLLTPLFEFSGACAGCGETPYLKLLSQLCGDRLLIANATGCSSIYGGNLPTTPWTINRAGRGPAWSNSLFEDNAEFGLGMRLAVDQLEKEAAHLLGCLPGLPAELVSALLGAKQDTEGEIQAQRDRASRLMEWIGKQPSPTYDRLRSVAEYLVRKSVWLVGGDGWAYDIGFGGLDHVLATGQNVKILVLDTEVYSNTGGQMSKSTPRAAVAKFAAAGKRGQKKDLALMAMHHDNVYVARIAMGASDSQTLRAFREAEAHVGPALILAYSHCIAHGYDLRHGMDQQKAAVLSGYWPLFRYDPALLDQGRPPLQLDSKPATIPLEKYIYNETRYTMLVQSQPQVARELLAEAQSDVARRWKLYEHLAHQSVPVASAMGGGQ